MTTISDSPKALAAMIPDGARVAIFKDCGVPVCLGRELIKRGARDLHIVTVPTGSLLIDMLIGAGCVKTVETSGVSLGEFGLAPRFIDAVTSGAISVRDATCPAVYAGLQAAEKGIPFMPLRGLLGTDVLRYRDDFRVINNPFSEADDPIVCLPAIQPDFTLLHCTVADRLGNLYIGRQAEFKLMAHAAKQTIATVEKIVDFNLLEDERYAASTLNALYVGSVAEVPGGARPLNLPGHYSLDRDTVAAYARAAQTQEGFRNWLDDDLTVAA